MFRILTPQHELIREIDQYNSLIWTRRWHKPGAFQLSINRHTYGANDIQKNGYILFTGLTGIIRHKEIALDETGKLSENWDVRGPDLSGIIAQRITVPPAGIAYDVITGPVETVMKTLVDHNLVNPVDSTRAIPNLMIAADQGRGQVVTWRSRYKQLDEELQSLSLLSGLGWGVEYDPATGTMTFEVYQGRDLTAGQSILPPVIFSPDFDNIKTQGFRESLLNLRNLAYVGGQGEGELRTIVEAFTGTEPTGIERYEMFQDGRDTNDVGELTTRGQEALTERGEELFFEAEILQNGPFRYKRDWDLGDIVTIQNKDWGLTMDARIVEVSIIQESNQPERINAVFGTSWPTLIDKLKQELGQTSKLVRI